MHVELVFGCNFLLPKTRLSGHELSDRGLLLFYHSGQLSDLRAVVSLVKVAAAVLTEVNHAAAPVGMLFARVQSELILEPISDLAHLPLHFNKLFLSLLHLCVETAAFLSLAQLLVDVRDLLIEVLLAFVIAADFGLLLLDGNLFLMDSCRSLLL